MKKISHKEVTSTDHIKKTYCIFFSNKKISKIKTKIKFGKKYWKKKRGFLKKKNSTEKKHTPHLVYVLFRCYFLTFIFSRDLFKASFFIFVHFYSTTKKIKLNDFFTNFFFAIHGKKGQLTKTITLAFNILFVSDRQKNKKKRIYTTK